jgi:D-alanyl-D-alanine carboxypeptidase/D-alanyl-D-alanine-endopeptidase (penicillin-binding protein 4)
MRGRAFAAALLSALAPQLDHALRVPHVSLGATGAIAVDLATGETLYAHNERTPLLPASNEKLAVSYGALVALGPAFRIETDVLQDSAGNLYLKGYGDPTLSSAQLHVLARQVRAAGITRVGSVYGDESWFDTRRTAVGWKTSFYIEESPPLSALIVDRGRIGRGTSYDPALAAAQLFRSALAQAGVRVARGAAHGVAPADAAVVAGVDSPTLLAILNRMDHESDNFYAEMLLKELGAVQVGRGSTSAGAGYVTGLLVAAGVPTTGVRIVDGSGLSLLDRMTASALVSLLGAMWRDPELRLALTSSLPVAGISGTLDDRMRTGPARGVVRAKTGTTSNASALSGFVGDRYAFSIIQNGYPVSFTWARVAQDRFATVLATAGQP